MKKIIAVLAAFMLSACAVVPAPVDVKALTEPIVRVTVDDGHGSGFILPGGKVVTAAHVVGDLGTVTVVPAANGAELEAEVVWRGEALGMDAAVLQLAPGDYEGLPTARVTCRELRPGETVYGVGYPGPLSIPVVVPLLVQPGRLPAADFGSGRSWVISGMIVSGMSGGPVYDVTGAVVGLNQLTFRNGFSPVDLGGIMPTSDICKAGITR